ncbi:MAG: cysteine dioxygenase family protein [Patescibacteria group bacterium]
METPESADSRFPPYERIILRHDDKMQVVLIIWPKGSRTRPHDHGNSMGFTILISGGLFEQIFDQKSKELRHVRAFDQPGDEFKETPEMIHVVGQYGEGEAVSLHIYLPPLNMTYYDELAVQLKP